MSVLLSSFCGLWKEATGDSCAAGARVGGLRSTTKGRKWSADGCMQQQADARAVRRELVLVEGLIRGLFVFQWRISSGGVERIDCVLGEIV